MLLQRFLYVIFLIPMLFSDTYSVTDYSDSNNPTSGTLRDGLDGVRRNRDLTFDDGSGTISIDSNAGTLPSIEKNDTVTLTPGANSVTIDGSGVGEVFDIIKKGTLIFGNNLTVIGDIKNEGELTFEESSSAHYAGEITGKGSVTKTGSGALTFTNITSYKGTTNVEGGELIIDGGSLEKSKTINVSSGAGVQFLTDDITNEIEGEGNLFIGSGATLTADYNKKGEISGVVSGTGNFNKKGGKKLTLSGENTLSGALVIEEGEIEITTGGDLVACPVEIKSGATLSSTANASIQDVTGLGTLSIDTGTTLTINSMTSTSFDGDSSGKGNLTKSGNATLTIPGSIDNQGDVEITEGKLFSQVQTHSKG
jgi:autotransporter-associated beta strand protein